MSLKVNQIVRKDNEGFLKKPGMGIRGGKRKVNWIFQVPKESSRGWARHETFYVGSVLTASVIRLGTAFGPPIHLRYYYFLRVRSGHQPNKSDVDASTHLNF